VKDPTATPAPSWWQSVSAWFGGSGKDHTLRLDINDLAGVAPAAPAAQRDQFVYVGQGGGYFFSPYDASMSEQLLRGFGQYLEGSLLDWQPGDFMPSCTPGDLRVSFAAQAPHKISVLAEVGPSSSTAAGAAAGGRSSEAAAAAGGEGTAAASGQLINLIPHSTVAAVSGQGSKKKSGTTVGLVHRGWRTPEVMLADEKSDAWWSAVLPRFVVLPLWALGVSRLMAMGLFGADLAHDGYSSRVAWLPATGGLWALVFGTVVAVVWQLWWPPHALLLWLSSVVLFLQARRHLPPPTVKSGPSAVWCMLAHWSGLPPNWRVEDGYVGALAAPMGEEGAGGNGGESSQGGNRCYNDDGTEMLLTAEVIDDDDDDDDGNYGGGGKGSGKDKSGGTAVPVVVAEAWAGSRLNNTSHSSSGNSRSSSSFGGGGVHRRSNSPGNNSSVPVAVAVVAPDQI